MDTVDTVYTMVTAVETTVETVETTVETAVAMGGETAEEMVATEQIR